MLSSKFHRTAETQWLEQRGLPIMLVSLNSLEDLFQKEVP